MHHGQHDPLAIDLDSLIGYNYMPYVQEHAHTGGPSSTHGRSDKGWTEELDLDELSKPHQLLEEIAVGHADTGGWGKESLRGPGKELYSRHKKVFVVEEEIAIRGRWGEQDFRSSEDIEFERGVLQLNEIAAQELERFDYTEAYNKLLTAEKRLISRLSIEPDPQQPPIWVLRLLSLTLNNLANHAKTIRDYNSSIKYLSRVLHIEREILDDPQEICSTYLNISAVLFEMGCFAESYEFALQSKDLLVQIDAQQHTDEEERQANSINMLQAIYNMGLCLEAQHNIPGARECFCRGFSVGVNELGNAHFMTQKFEKKLIGNELNLESSARTPSTDIGQGSRMNYHPNYEGEKSSYQKADNQFGSNLPAVHTKSSKHTQRQPNMRLQQVETHNLTPKSSVSRAKLNMTFNGNAFAQKNSLQSEMKELSQKHDKMQQQNATLHLRKLNEKPISVRNPLHAGILNPRGTQHVFLPQVGSAGLSNMSVPHNSRYLKTSLQADNPQVYASGGRQDRYDPSPIRDGKPKLPEQMHRLLRNMALPKNLPKNLAQTISHNKSAKVAQLERSAEVRPQQNYTMAYSTRRPPISNLPQALLMNYQEKQRMVNEVLSAHREKSQTKSTHKKRSRQNQHQLSPLEPVEPPERSQRSGMLRSLEPKDTRISALGQQRNERSSSIIRNHNRSQTLSMHAESEQRSKHPTQERLHEIFSLDPRRSRNSQSAIRNSHPRGLAGRPDFSDQSLVTNTPSRSAHGAKPTKLAQTVNSSAFERVVMNPDNIEVSKVNTSYGRPFVQNASRGTPKHTGAAAQDDTHKKQSQQVPHIRDFPSLQKQQSSSPGHPQAEPQQANTPKREKDQSFQLSSEQTPARSSHYGEAGKPDFIQHTSAEHRDDTPGKRRSKKLKTTSSDVTEEQHGDSRREPTSDRPRLSMPAAKSPNQDLTTLPEKRDPYPSADYAAELGSEPDEVFQTYPRRPKSRKGKRLESSGSFPMRISEQPIEESADGSRKLHSSIDQIHPHDISNPDLNRRSKQPLTAYPSAASTPRDRIADPKLSERKSVHQPATHHNVSATLDLLAQKYLRDAKQGDKDNKILIQNTGVTPGSVKQNQQFVLSPTPLDQVLKESPLPKQKEENPSLGLSARLAAHEDGSPRKLVTTARSGAPKPFSSSVQPTPRIPVTNLSQSRPVSQGESIELQLDSIVEPVNTPRDRSEDGGKLIKKSAFAPEYQSAHNIAREPKRSVTIRPNLDSAQSASILTGASQPQQLVSNTIVIKDPNLKGHQDSGSQMKIYIGSGQASRRGSNAEASLLSDYQPSLAGMSNRAPGVHQITFKRKPASVMSRTDLNQSMEASKSPKPAGLRDTHRTLDSVHVVPKQFDGILESNPVRESTKAKVPEPTDKKTIVTAADAKTYNQVQAPNPVTAPAKSDLVKQDPQPAPVTSQVTTSKPVESKPHEPATVPKLTSDIPATQVAPKDSSTRPAAADTKPAHEAQMPPSPQQKVPDTGTLSQLAEKAHPPTEKAPILPEVAQTHQKEKVSVEGGLSKTTEPPPLSKQQPPVHPDADDF